LRSLKAELLTEDELGVEGDGFFALPLLTLGVSSALRQYVLCHLASLS
jgi:hypothetical protein